MRLSQNFTLSELCKSQTAERKGLLNLPDTDQIEALEKLCAYILQPIRDEFGSFIVSSGYRSPELCVAIGSKITSQHTANNGAAAADFEVAGHDNYELCKWIEANLPFDQLILECYNGEPNSGWVHCSYADEGRRETLTYSKAKGYRQGLLKDG
mgnify:FL=1